MYRRLPVFISCLSGLMRLTYFKYLFLRDHQLQVSTQGVLANASSKHACAGGLASCRVPPNLWPKIKPPKKGQSVSKQWPIGWLPNHNTQWKALYIKLEYWTGTYKLNENALNALSPRRCQLRSKWLMYDTISEGNIEFQVRLDWISYWRSPTYNTINWKLSFVQLLPWALCVITTL